MPKALSWSDLDQVEVLGEGKAGVVHLAVLKKAYRHLSAGSHVAIKTYKAWVLEEPGQYERIIRELEAGRTIDHKNVVRTLTILKSPDGTPALVMKYYGGESLQALIERQRHAGDRIPLHLAFQIVEGLASGIAAIHKAGCIHRDIKPANVLLEGPNAVIMDFGVVRSSDLPEQTTTGNFLGTLRYAPPEYIFGEKYDERVDIYAFGALVYEILGGEAFLSDAKHWAKVIVKKSDVHRHGEASPAFYRGVEQRGGISMAAFVKYILHSSLCSTEERSLDLTNVADACRQKFWEGPFFTIDGKVSRGVTPELFKWGNKDARSVPQIVEHINHEFSAEERRYLLKLLKEHYWNRNFGGDYHGDHLFRKFVDESAAVLAVNYDSGDYTCLFHPAVRLAYRYGLIQTA